MRTAIWIITPVSLLVVACVTGVLAWAARKGREYADIMPRLPGERISDERGSR